MFLAKFTLFFFAIWSITKFIEEELASVNTGWEVFVVWLVIGAVIVLELTPQLLAGLLAYRYYSRYRVLSSIFEMKDCFTFWAEWW